MFLVIEKNYFIFLKYKDPFCVERYIKSSTYVLTFRDEPCYYTFHSGTRHHEVPDVVCVTVAQGGTA